MAERVWTCKDALAWTAEYLAAKGDEHPRRSAEWLLSAATGLSRVELYALYDRPLTPEERVRYRELVARRAEGMPLQYVTGEMPFRHLVISVQPGVFIPRPETEVLVDVVLEHITGIAAPTVIDLCTGSGCVAVALASEHPGASVWATDTDERAVAAARRNALHAGVSERVQVVEGDLFEGLPDDRVAGIDAIVSNPPYVPSGEIGGLPTEVVGFEPVAALDGGTDGLDVFRGIAAQSVRWLKPGGVLAVELDSRRAEDAARVLERDYDGVVIRQDLTGRDRIVFGRKG